MEMDMESEFKPFVFLRYTTNIIVHMMSAINLYAVWKYAVDYFNGKFQLHIIFSTIGYQFLMMEAIMTLSQDNTWSFMLPRVIKKRIHMILQIAGAACVITGFGLIVSQHQSLNLSHFTTAHGICGLIGFIFSVISLLNGFLTVLTYKTLHIRRTPIKAVHTVCGCVSIIMGLVTLCLGVNKGLSLQKDKGTMILITVFAVLTLLYVLLSPIINIKTYAKNMKTTTL